MKNKTIGTILIVLSIALMIIGTVLLYDNKTTPKKEEKPETTKDPNYTEIGAASLKEDQIFNNIKYTQNHLSTTEKTSYATFTSVVYNETNQRIEHQKIAIDFFDANASLIGTMESEINGVESGQSTVIFAVATTDLSIATSFKVRQIAE